LTGDGGAYISESCASSEGEVRAEKRCRMLSHCVSVVCKDDWRVTRRDEDGEEAEGGYDALN
jgi:hypothetical protein